MRLNMTQLQSTLAPILAPIAPAILFGNNLHTGMIADGVHPWLAMGGAWLGTIGVELSGALACSMAVLAYHKRDYKIMSLSILAALIYAIFVMVGILQAKNTATFAGAVVISLVAYLVQGIWQSYNNRIQMQQAESDIRVRELDAKRRLVNSETRRAKVKKPVFSEQNEQQTEQIEQLNSTTLAMVCEYLAANPGVSARDLLRIPGIPFTAPATASKYKKAAEEILK